MVKQHKRDNFVSSFIPIFNVIERLNFTLMLSGQLNQSLDVLAYFRANNQSLTDKFFVEAGAYDGEILSNTLFLETEYHWTGLLVEANPEAYAKLKQKNRDSMGTNACLSVTNRSEMVDFDGADWYGGIKSVPAER